MDTQLKGKAVVLPPEPSASGGAGLGDVAVSGAPAVGKVITADSSTEASWKTPADADLATRANPSFSGTMTLLGLGSRILGDFTNASFSQRSLFQTSVENGTTSLGVIPNGTAAATGFLLFGGSDPANAQFLHFSCVGGVSTSIRSRYVGTPASGTFLPIEFYVGDVVRQTLLPTGEVGIGVTPQVGKGTLQVPNINGGQLAGNRRLNRNGNFDIWQRGAGPFTASGYTADGWIAGITAGTVAVSRSPFTVGDYYGATRPQYAFRWNQSVAGASNTLLHRVPDVRKFDARTVTVSFWAVASAGSVAAQVQTSQYFGSGGSTQTYQTSQAATITTTRTKFSLTFDLPSITGKTVGTGDYGIVSINWPNAAFDVYISEFQIEYGAVATPFELWDSAVELAACRRWLRVQAVRVNTSATPTCMTIDMAAVPNISGGGTGYTSTGTTADTLICYQTTAAVQTITMSCEQ